jgi:hypothetical protein
MQAISPQIEIYLIQLIFDILIHFILKNMRFNSQNYLLYHTK